ncbi:MAG TPA: hypothetical protein VK461_15745 [Acidimicrobiales bacterium]|nr:hypothetical protein [Acidimicrobiales bacterium]
MTAPTIAELILGGHPERWHDAGFTVDEGGQVVVGTVTITVRPDIGSGLKRWVLRGDAPQSIDGLSTRVASHADLPDTVVHPNHIVAIDHLVVLTQDLDRTIDALAGVGLELRRIREGPAGDGRQVKQAFFRMAEVILEVVATSSGPADHAYFWGVTFLSDDLDATLSYLGPDRVSEARPAVQPGRRIATLRNVHLGLPGVAVMSG